MKRAVFLLVAGILMVGLFWLPTAAQAAASSSALTVEGTYWSGNGTVSFGGSRGTWNTPLYGADIRYESGSPWGFHGTVFTGTQSGWSVAGGFPSIAGNSTDTLWTADVTYRFDFPSGSPRKLATVHVYAGYGGANTTINTTSFGGLPATINGPRIGADLQYPFGGGFSLNAGGTWFPSNNTSGSFFSTIPGASPGGNTNGVDYFGTLRYTSLDGWVIEAGYRYSETNTGSSGANFQWQGFIGAVGKTFTF